MADNDIDYGEIAEAVDTMREMINAMVAGLIDDGFDGDQARAIVAGLWAGRVKRSDDD